MSTNNDPSSDSDCPSRVLLLRDLIKDLKKQYEMSEEIIKQSNRERWAKIGRMNLIKRAERLRRHN
jgi:hypothetical protein